MKNKIFYTICPVLGYDTNGERIIDYDEWADDQRFRDKDEAYDYMYDNNLQDGYTIVDWEES